MKLLRELTREERELEVVAGRVSNMAVPHLSKEAQERIAEDLGIRRIPWFERPMTIASGAAACLVILVLVAQFSRPGGTLYSVKKGSDGVRTFIQRNIDPAEDVKVNQNGAPGDDSRLETIPLSDFSQGTPDDKKSSNSGKNASLVNASDRQRLDGGGSGSNSGDNTSNKVETQNNTSGSNTSGDGSSHSGSDSGSGRGGGGHSGPH